FVLRRNQYEWHKFVNHGCRTRLRTRMVSTLIIRRRYPPTSDRNLLWGFGDRTVHSEASFRQLNRAAELRAACKWITSASTVVPLRVDEARRPRKLLGLPRPCVVAGAGFPEHYTAPETYVRRFNTARLRAGNRSTCPRSVAMDLPRNRSPNFSSSRCRRRPQRQAWRRSPV